MGGLGWSGLFEISSLISPLGLFIVFSSSGKPYPTLHCLLCNFQSPAGLEPGTRTNTKQEFISLRGVGMTSPSFRYLVQLHKDIPKAARFYSEGLGFTISVCTLRWAELHSGPLKLALLHSSREHVQKCYSSLLSFTVTDINATVTKLMTLGAQLDGPIKHEIHGKVAAMRCADGHVLGLYEPS